MLVLVLVLALVLVDLVSSSEQKKLVVQIVVASRQGGRASGGKNGPGPTLHGSRQVSTADLRSKGTALQNLLFCRLTCSIGQSPAPAAWMKL